MPVATRVAEAKASILTVEDRLWRSAIKLWTDIHTLPATNPLRKNTSRIRKARPRYRSLLYRVADSLKDVEMEHMETIRSFTLTPWEKRVQIITDSATTTQSNLNQAAVIAVSSSARNGLVGFDHASSKASVSGTTPLSRSESPLQGQEKNRTRYVDELAAGSYGKNTTASRF